MKKRAITLIEIMIVMVLIGIIGGAVAYNMRGALTKGKDFKTDQHKARVYELLMLEYAMGNRSLQEIADSWEDILMKNTLKNGKELLKDGYGKKFIVHLNEQKDDFVIVSQP